MAIVRRTFFQHFCAGVDSEDIKPRLTQLKKSGVGAILDYAAEADVAAVPVVENASTIASEEALCDANAKCVHVCMIALVCPSNFELKHATHKHNIKAMDGCELL